MRIVNYYRFLVTLDDSLFFMFYVRYLSVSLSLTLGKNEKVEQYIRKKTHNPNVLRFWIGGNVIPLYGLAQFSLFDISLRFSPSDSSNIL